MIPQAYITEWANQVPWQTNEQVEQDLVICRALVEIFSDEWLASSFQQIIVPKPEIMKAFHEKALLIQKQIAILGQQNLSLRKIRDRLLPRLISGKLQVKEATETLNELV